MPGRHYHPDAIRSEQRIAVFRRRLSITAAMAATATVVGLIGASASGAPEPLARPSAAVVPQATAGLPLGLSTPTPTITTSTSASATAIASPTPSKSPTSSAPAAVTPDRTETATDIPLIAIQAYSAAARWSTENDPGCNMNWRYLAAFGRVESNHGRDGGSNLRSDGVAVPSIYGAPIAGLAGSGGKTVRAAGPMQFIPSTWASYGTGNIQNINNASLAAAKYLCADGENVATTAGRIAGALSYNHVAWYAADIEAVYEAYVKNTILVSYPSASPTAQPSAKPTPPAGRHSSAKPTHTITPTPSRAPVSPSSPTTTPSPSAPVDSLTPSE